jgi:CIC family chloride channel protein
MRRLRRIAIRQMGILRRQFRDQEARIVGFSCVLGVLVGLSVVVLHKLLFGAQKLLFGMPHEAILGGTDSLPSWKYALVPAAGGLLLGLAAHIAQRLRPTEIVDPIEANALYGGQMSLRGSLRLTWLTMLSNLSGASVGMEAGYSQLGAGIHSAAARPLRLRREDRRSLTTAGAAAAIAAAFDAPLAGAFYGFELVHGTYSPRNLAIVGMAVVSSTITRRMVDPGGSLFVVQYLSPVIEQTLPFFLLVGLLAAAVGIATMRLVSVFERFYSAVRLPSVLRPAIGGGFVGAMALLNPQILGSGHEAIEPNLLLDRGWWIVAVLLVGKIIASALSLGSGFRGGLFSSSLFIGCLLGAVIHAPFALLLPWLEESRVAFMLVGMAAVGAAITGAPLTMVFLILEISDSFIFSVSVLASALLASTVVRLTFGYSFSTWRFHLRGQPVLGAHDIGWVSELTAERLMRKDFRVVPLHWTVTALRQQFPLGAAKYAFAVDGAGRFAGSIDMAAVHDPDFSDLSDHLCAADFATGTQHFVEKGNNVLAILDRFSSTRLEVLPVIESRTSMRLSGIVSEAYCLKRYTIELESRRRDEIGAP